MKVYRFLAHSLVGGLAVSIVLSPSFVEAARKYYPPGFTPPSDALVNPATAPAPSPPPPPKSEPIIIVQPAPPPGKQVIIKTVPTVKVLPPKPRDPLAVLIDERRYYDALRLVDKRLKKAPNNVSLQLTRGQLLRDDKQYAQAVEQFNAVLRKTRSRSLRARAWNGLGWTWYQKALREKNTGHKNAFRISVDSSESAFKTAIQLSPASVYAWAGLGRLQLLSGKMPEAEKTIRHADRLAPNNLETQLAQADLLLTKHKPQDALQILYGLKKTTTSEPDVYFLLAQGSMETDRVDDAIINLKQLLEMEPNHTEALKLLSRAYDLKMKPEAAKNTLETAIALNPSDTKSAEEMLKIYDQQGDTEHSILLLKNLLKSQPEQPEYIQALLTRLGRTNRWDEAYQEGIRAVPAMLDNASSDSETVMPALMAFARVTFEKGRGLLDRRVLWQEPAVSRALSYARLHWQHLTTAPNPAFFSSVLLQLRLTLLYLDPLVNLPPLPSSGQPAPEDLGKALECAFLAGEAEVHDKLIEQAKKNTALSGNPAPRIEIANNLYNIGDFSGADSLSQNVTAPGALLLQEQLASARLESQDHLTALSVLSRKTSDPYWQKMAGDVLRVGGGDYRTHARLAKILEKKHLSNLAYYHLQLAARYAPTPKEKEHWLHQLGKRPTSLRKTPSAAKPDTVARPNPIP